MVKVSHEVPLCLLDLSEQLNDYEFCLPHLMDENPIYREHFLKAKRNGRYIIMDNSLHELGEAYDTKRLLHWIKELEPNEFVVPDVWENKTQSIVQAKYWSQIELPEGVEKMVVVQATTLHEAFLCVQTYKDLGYKKIAFSYGSSYYNDICKHPNKDLGKALGRLFVISTLYSQGALTKYDRVHLLGTAVPQEFGWYKGIDCIESLDTSNPVMSALNGVAYTEAGLTEKPKANLNNDFKMSIDEIDVSLVLSNVKRFKKINNI